jgi:hypothetical protein
LVREAEALIENDLSEELIRWWNLNINETEPSPTVEKLITNQLKEIKIQI